MMQTRRFLRTAAAAALVALVAGSACEPDVSDRILSVSSAGSVSVLLYRDDNLSSGFSSNFDTRLVEFTIALRATGASSDFRDQRTDSAGIAHFAPVPVGRYRAMISPDVLGDSLVLVDSVIEFTVEVRDTVVVPLGVRFRSFTISEARELPIGTKGWVRGIAANTPGTFGDSTVHLFDAEAAIRMSRVRPDAPVTFADSVQLFGTRSERGGQPTFNLPIGPDGIRAVLIRGVVDPPPQPDTLVAAEVATAGGGPLDGAFVKLFGLTVLDTLSTIEGYRLTVTDASGSAPMLLTWDRFNPLSSYEPGRTFDAAGLLVPDPQNSGRWVLRPRGRGDTVFPRF